MGALAAVLIARFSKTKAERESGLAADYLKLADMSGDQLEKRINLIGKLESRITELEDHRDKREKQFKLQQTALEERINELEDHRTKRDEEIKVERFARDREFAELTAKQLLDVEQTQKLLVEVGDLHVRVRAGDEKYKAAKSVIEKLFKVLKAANIDVPDLNGDLPDSIKGWRWDDKK